MVLWEQLNKRRKIDNQLKLIFKWEIAKITLACSNAEVW